MDAGKRGDDRRRGANVPPFSMAFQPIVDTTRRRVFAYEALVRGPRGEGAMSVIQAVGEEARAAFDRGCRRAALALAGALGLAADDSLLSVNFMPSAVGDPEADLAPTLALAASLGLPADRLVFEVPEGERLARDRLVRIVSAYKGLGVRTAIDDFGAGYSGLTLLAKVQPDFVKLDMELVRGLDGDRVRRALVAGVLGACREIGVEVVAEGIETPGEHQALVDLGVSLQQGYLFARPGFETLPPVAWPDARPLTEAA